MDVNALLAKLPANITKQQLVFEIERQLLEKSFKRFVAEAWQHIDPAPYTHNWHIDAVCDRLQGVAEGRNKRLLINVPPGSAKSMLVGVLFPAWMWTHTPSWSCISTSHAKDQAIRDTRKSRELMRSEWYSARWPITFKDDQDQKGSYENDQLGSRNALPITGLTGRRGNCVIVDDPHSVDGAKSEAERRSTVETFREAVPSRLNNLDEDTIIVIMQRLHEDDVAGVIIADMPEYEMLIIPMEYEGESEPCDGWIDPRTQEGELMFAARFSATAVQRIKNSLGSFAYAGQYQQAPAPKTDGFFKREWFHTYGSKPCALCGDSVTHAKPKLDELNIYMASDHAPGGKNDYNCVRVWGVDRLRNQYLIDSFYERSEMTKAFGVELNRGRTRLLATGALPFIKKYKPYCWFAENDPTWAAMKGSVRTWMLDTDAVCRIEAISAKGDKIAKALAYQQQASIGRIYLPESEVGQKALLEYVKFPAGKHDDQVDADGLLSRMIDTAHPAFVLPGQEVEDEFDYDFRPRREQRADSDTFWG